MYNQAAEAGTRMVTRERQREEIASDYYHGGMVVDRSGQLHPAMYYGGMLKATARAGARLCAHVDAGRIDRKSGGGFTVSTDKGVIEAREVVIATNGYTGNVTPSLKRRLVPVASHIIATEELPEDLAKSLIPKGRTISDSKRVLCYYRLSPDGKRVIFGGRARFTQVPPEVSAPVLHRYMTDRWPQLKGYKQRCIRIRLPPAHGPGQRHALRNGMQRQWRGHDDVSRLPDRAEDRRWFHGSGQRFRWAGISHRSLLRRQSLVPAVGGQLVPHPRLAGPEGHVSRP
jgi:glycine/D-amino acid oxidase-like deaminating enzyme